MTSPPARHPPRVTANRVIGAALMLVVFLVGAAGAGLIFWGAVGDATYDRDGNPAGGSQWLLVYIGFAVIGLAFAAGNGIVWLFADHDSDPVDDALLASMVLLPVAGTTAVALHVLDVI